jgi:hypothetical protein
MVASPSPLPGRKSVRKSESPPVDVRAIELMEVVPSLMTPKEVFAEMKKAGLRVDYERLPVTDEQAPIPNVYSRIEERVTAALQLKDEDVGLGEHLSIYLPPCTLLTSACSLQLPDGTRKDDNWDDCSRSHRQHPLLNLRLRPLWIDRRGGHHSSVSCLGRERSRSVSPRVRHISSSSSIVGSDPDTEASSQ